MSALTDAAVLAGDTIERLQAERDAANARAEGLEASLRVSQQIVADQRADLEQARTERADWERITQTAASALRTELEAALARVAELEGVGQRLTARVVAVEDERDRLRAQVAALARVAELRTSLLAELNLPADSPDEWIVDSVKARKDALDLTRGSRETNARRLAETRAQVAALAGELEQAAAEAMARALAEPPMSTARAQHIARHVELDRMPPKLRAILGPEGGGVRCDHDFADVTPDLGDGKRITTWWRCKRCGHDATTPEVRRMGKLLADGGK